MKHPPKTVIAARVSPEIAKWMRRVSKNTKKQGYHMTVSQLVESVLEDRYDDRKKTLTFSKWSVK